jgi:hypothetical protein
MPRRPPNTRPLTERQERFCREYLAGGRNAAGAYRTSYSAGRMSDKAVRVAACRLLKDVRIRARVDAVVEAAEQKTQITVESTLRRLDAEASYHGEGASHSARVSALVAIGKHLGMFPARRLELTGPDGKPIQTEDKTPTLTPEEVTQRLYYLFQIAQQKKADGDSTMSDQFDEMAGQTTGNADHAASN